MKRLIQTILLILTLLLSISNNVFAETIYTEGALNYVIRDGNIIIVGYFGSNSKVEVPDHVGGYVVTGIASGALTKDCIEKVILPETITTIEEGAIEEHTKTIIEDGYGNTVKEDDISSIEVEEGFFIESEEYDNLIDIENQDDDIFDDEEEQEEIVEDIKIEEKEAFEEIYSSKVSTKVETVNYLLIITCISIVVIVGLFLFMLLKKKKEVRK